jgi:hypothetical protein
MARRKRTMMEAYEAAEASYDAEREEVCETPSARCYGNPRWMRTGLALRFICAQCAHDWQVGANTPREASCEGYTTEEGAQCGSTTRLGVILSGVYCAGCRGSVADADAWHAEGACAGCPIHQHAYEY